MTHAPNVAVVQARMASTRLPGKALAKLGEAPLIYHVLERGKRIPGIHEVVLATSASKENDALEAYARTLGVDVLRGDEDDVIDRIYRICAPRKAANIVRLTGDNPLLDYSAIGFLLGRHAQARADYSCISGLPVGAGADIFSFHALEQSHFCADGKKLSDHVDLYVLENQEKFLIQRFILEPALSRVRWTVDDPADIARVRKLVAAESQSILDQTTAGLLRLMDEHCLREEMSPEVANTSPQNVYTGELVGKIKRCETLRLCDINRV
jgi:spore coat polysaccharide biosynthesis protein SpsF